MIWKNAKKKKLKKRYKNCNRQELCLVLLVIYIPEPVRKTTNKFAVVFKSNKTASGSGKN